MDAIWTQRDGCLIEQPICLVERVSICCGSVMHESRACSYPDVSQSVVLFHLEKHHVDSIYLSPLWRLETTPPLRHLKPVRP